MGPYERTHHKPVLLRTRVFDSIGEDNDPAQLCEAAEQAAHMLVYRTRGSSDPFLMQRLIGLTDAEGLEFLSSLWSQSAERTLSRSLWRLYAIRAVIEKDPERIRIFYELGKNSHDVNLVIAGLADPPSIGEICHAATDILSGAFAGDFDIALQRFAAFCRIISTGQRAQAEAYGGDGPFRAKASRLNAYAFRLEETADRLGEAATLWRDGMLN